jgi:helicase
LPTGAGKTWLAEQAIAAALCAGARAIYLTPLRALANELLERWALRFEGHEVGVFTGEYGQRQAFPVPFERARLLIMTPERLDLCTRQWRSHWRWFPKVSLLVIDEFHLLGERRRGPRLEGALLRARRLNPFLQVVGLSATLGNRAELAEWLEGVHYGSSWKPIPVEWRTVRYRRASEKPRILTDQVRKCVDDGGQSLVFVESRRRAEELSTILCDAGIAAAHHHAGLEPQVRRQIEGNYRAGLVRAIVSTGTLEMGLNLPARQVVLYDLQSFNGSDFVPLSVNTVWQRAGRAGRRGLDTHGEVVLVAPSWDREVLRYQAGRFEKITSQLSDPRALAEQILAEVSSSLARTRAQLARNLQQSLAAYQQRLPLLDQVVSEMIDSGMLIEVSKTGASVQELKPTRPGRIAVRQMLSPSTVVTLARWLKGKDTADLTFLDILIVCAVTEDCEPLIPADFEELDSLSERLSRERSLLLSSNHNRIPECLSLPSRRLLAVIKTALIVRAWTRLGNIEDVANAFDCYGLEVRHLCESIQRILTAAVAIVAPVKEQTDASPSFDTPEEAPRIAERVRALAAMVERGVDEQTVTLTYIEGIGGKLAHRLRDVGVTDIEDLALADATKLGAVRGVSAKRATAWISEATSMIRNRSAFTFRDIGPVPRYSKSSWHSAVNPYKLRRALDLTVQVLRDGFIVSGGLEPHKVSFAASRAACDCADFAEGRPCKHVLAVRIHQNDPELLPLIERVSSEGNTGALDLFRLWFN